MNKSIALLLKSKRPVYFISPHLDDAILSAGDLLSYLAKKVPVNVINVFTAVHQERPTFSAQQFVKKCGAANITELYQARIIEDAQVMKTAGCKSQNLGFVDAMWRRPAQLPFWRQLLGILLPEFIHTYPTYRWHIKNRAISPFDDTLLTSLRAKLITILPKGAIIFCPLSLGDHIDHVIVRNVCESLGHDLYFWTDFPYINEAAKDELAQLPKPIENFSWDHDRVRKSQIIRGYISQQDVLFHHNQIMLQSEIYYHRPARATIPTLTIGIPAYNESKNIAHLLTNLAEQHHRFYKLDQVIVVSDGSTDKTVLAAKTINIPNLHLIQNTERRGVAASENIIFTKASGDLCLLLHADVLPVKADFLDQLVYAQIATSADLLAGNLVPLPPRSVLGHILYIGARWKHAAYEIYRGGNSLYTCYGPCRLFTKRLYQRLRFKESFSEDMYSYLAAKGLGFSYAFVQSALLNYRLPENIREHLLQSVRFFVSPRVLDSSFNQVTVTQELKLPTKTLFKTSIQYFHYSPLKLLAYLLLAITTKFVASFDKSTLNTTTWQIAESSKQL